MTVPAAKVGGAELKTKMAISQISILSSFAIVVCSTVSDGVIKPVSAWVPISSSTPTPQALNTFCHRRRGCDPYEHLFQRHDKRSLDSQICCHAMKPPASPVSSSTEDRDDPTEVVDKDDVEILESKNDDDEDDGLLSSSSYYQTDDREEDWISDAEIAKRQKASGKGGRDYLIPAQDVIKPYSVGKEQDDDDENGVDNNEVSFEYKIEGGDDDEEDLFEDDDIEIEDMLSSLESEEEENDGKVAAEEGKSASSTGRKSSTAKASKPLPSPYTEEEEELIAAMGGKYRATSTTVDPITKKQKKKSTPRRREEGFLGDSTLEEIALDYSVPICYLADVLCTKWGVPVPINTKDRLGDLVTGEQAFALVEAVNSLDIAFIQDQYTNMSFQQLCHEWDIDLKKAFEYAMTEGWTLPFGIRTILRQDQEDELLRTFSALYEEDDDDLEYDTGYR